MAKLRSLLPKKFETPHKVHEWHSRLVRDLSRVHPDHPALPVFRACEKGNRCGLEGCPKCRRVFRRQLVREVHRLGLGDGIWTSVTVIPRKWKVRAGHLHEVDLRKVVGRTLQAFRRQPLLRGLVIVGGVDVSWEVHDNGVGYWQLHLHLMVRMENTAELKLAFQSAFKGEPSARVPILCEPSDSHGFFEALTYAYKNSFERNSHYAEKRLRRDGAARRNSRSFDVHRVQSRELAAWLLKSPVGSRLIVRGMKRTSRPSSRLRLGWVKAVL